MYKKYMIYYDFCERMFHYGYSVSVMVSENKRSAGAGCGNTRKWCIYVIDSGGFCAVSCVLVPGSKNRKIWPVMFQCGTVSESDMQGGLLYSTSLDQK